MARRSTSATIAEVAARAGVSPATVSRVMNGRFFGEPAVAERVQAVAAELHYQPSHLARSLALGQTNAIAFVVPDLANPAFQAILASLSKTAARDGYRVLVADSAESPHDEPLLASEIRHRCDAIILCAPRMPVSDLNAIAGSLAPLVLINRFSERIETPSLTIDYRSGILALARHLHTLGHRRFAYLEGPTSSISNLQRVQGLEAFEREAPGIDVQRMPGGVTTDDGIAAAEAVRGSGATAVLAFNDLVAIGLMGGLAQLGVRVPHDISVTGFDDIPFARFTSPSLTTASVPHTALGVEAWHRMHALIRGDRVDTNASFTPHLEVRDSTTSPAG